MNRTVNKCFIPLTLIELKAFLIQLIMAEASNTSIEKEAMNQIPGNFNDCIAFFKKVKCDILSF